MDEISAGSWPLQWLILRAGTSGREGGAEAHSLSHRQKTRVLCLHLLRLEPCVHDARHRGAHVQESRRCTSLQLVAR